MGTNNPTLALDLPFKGERDYLHGTNLFDALVEHTGATQGLSLRMRRMMRTGLSLTRCEDARRLKAAAGEFRWTDAHGEPRRVAVEEDGREVTARVPYDEAAVTKEARFGERSGQRCVELAADPSYRGIERLVAHHKVLLQREVAPGPWLFTSIELLRWPLPDAGLRIVLEQTLGTRTARSAIECGGERVGRITFTARP